MKSFVLVRLANPPDDKTRAAVEKQFKDILPDTPVCVIGPGIHVEIMGDKNPTLAPQ